MPKPTMFRLGSPLPLIMNDERGTHVDVQRIGDKYYASGVYRSITPAERKAAIEVYRAIELTLLQHSAKLSKPKRLEPKPGKRDIPNFMAWSLLRLRQEASSLGMPGWMTMGRKELIDWLTEAYM